MTQRYQKLLSDLAGTPQQAEVIEMWHLINALQESMKELQFRNKELRQEIKILETKINHMPS